MNDRGVEPLIDENVAGLRNAGKAMATVQISSPRIPEVGVIGLVPDRWHWQWQPRHQVMTRLAQYFPVVWMNPAENWRHSLNFRKLLARRTETPVAETAFVVHTPSPLLPEFYSLSWLAKLTLAKRLQDSRRLLLKMGCKKVVLYLWRPEFAPALDCVPYDLSCYHIDDEYSFSTVETPTPQLEASLIARVDQVFIHSPALLEKKGKINPNTSHTPNGVDFDAYMRPVPEPADLAGIPHPRIGYSGHVKKQLDWPLLMELSATHPEWCFVFVGAATAHPEMAPHLEELSRRTNVRFLGGKTARELAAYPQHFDVCLMPYQQDDYTKYIYPLKLHEYLASGRPIVGTPIASLEPFRSVVWLPENTQQWSAAISEALRPAANSAQVCAARQSVAQKHDWQILVRQIAEILAGHLGPPYADLFAKYFPPGAGAESPAEAAPSSGALTPVFSRRKLPGIG